MSSDLNSRAQWVQQYENAAKDLEPAMVDKRSNDQVAMLITHCPPRRQGDGGAPPRNARGQWLKPGKPFCTVGDPHKLEAHLILDQSDIDPDQRTTKTGDATGLDQNLWHVRI